MSRPRFALTSEQLELLLAFEHCGGLSKLATYMAKDPSVISRQLQRLAEAAPVLVKVDGRWQISPLGCQINARSTIFLSDLAALVGGADAPRPARKRLAKPALLVINAQRGLLDKLQGNRSNAEAEDNLALIIAKFRKAGDPVLHVRHVSQNPQSPFHSGSPGAAFMQGFAPTLDEVVVDKSKASAFAETNLLQLLNERQIETVVVTGFTANECIDATARQATEHGFATLVVGDATASFDLVGPDGKLHPAERVHKLTLANLHQYFAEVLRTAELLPIV